MIDTIASSGAQNSSDADKWFSCSATWLDKASAVIEAG